MKKITAKLIGNKIFVDDIFYVKTNSSGFVKKHFSLHNFMWFENDKKKLSYMEILMMKIQPYISKLNHLYPDFILTDHSNISVEIRMKKTKGRKYVLIIDNKSICISRSIYYLFPNNNIINLNDEI